jgi:hypothetical protein
MIYTARELEGRLDNIVTEYTHFEQSAQATIQRLWEESNRQRNRNIAYDRLRSHFSVEALERLESSSEEVVAQGASRERVEDASGPSGEMVEEVDQGQVLRDLIELKQALVILREESVRSNDSDSETARTVELGTMIERTDRWLEEAERHHHETEQNKPVLRPPHTHENHHRHGNSWWHQVKRNVQAVLPEVRRFKGDLDETGHVAGLIAQTSDKIAKAGGSGLIKGWTDSGHQLSVAPIEWMRDQILPSDAAQAWIAIGFDAMVVPLALLAIYAAAREIGESRHDRPILDKMIQDLSPTEKALKNLDAVDFSLASEGGFISDWERFTKIQRIGNEQELTQLKMSASQNRLHGLMAASSIGAGLGILANVAFDMGVKGQWLHRGGAVSGTLSRAATVLGSATTLGLVPFTGAMVFALGIAAFMKIREQRGYFRLGETGLVAQNWVSRDIRDQETFNNKYHPGMLAFMLGGLLYAAFASYTMAQVLSSILKAGQWLDHTYTVPIQQGGLLVAAAPLLKGSLSLIYGHPNQDQNQQDLQIKDEDRNLFKALSLAARFDRNVDPQLAFQRMREYSNQSNERERCRANFANNKAALLTQMQYQDDYVPTREQRADFIDWMRDMHQPLENWLEIGTKSVLCESYGATRANTESNDLAASSNTINLPENVGLLEIRALKKTIIDYHRRVETYQLKLDQAKDLSRDLECLSERLSASDGPGVNAADLSQVIDRFISLQMGKAYQTSSQMVNDPDVLLRTSFQKLTDHLGDDFKKAYETRQSMIREASLDIGRLSNRVERKVAEEKAALEPRRVSVWSRLQSLFLPQP